MNICANFCLILFLNPNSLFDWQNGCDGLFDNNVPIETGQRGFLCGWDVKNV